MRKLVVPAADLIVGARCAGCGRPALALCHACGVAMRPTPVPAVLGRQIIDVDVVAGGLNQGILRRVLVAWKEEGVTRLTGTLAHHLAVAVLPMTTAGRPITLVPVPTTRRSRRARGCDLVDELAREAAKLLRGLQIDVGVEQVLTHARQTQDQAGLGAKARHDNLAGALRTRREVPGPDRDVVVIDDIVTTGATVTEAVRALADAGRRPVGIALAATTPRHS